MQYKPQDILTICNKNKEGLEFDEFDHLVDYFKTYKIASRHYDKIRRHYIEIQGDLNDDKRTMEKNIKQHPILGRLEAVLTLNETIAKRIREKRKLKYCSLCIDIYETGATGQAYFDIIERMALDI